jgi:UDP-arabinose 4-epimerase
MTFPDERRVLVTGGAGFIGAHACKALAETGALPVAFDNLSNGHADAVRWGPLVRGDVRDRGALISAIRQFRTTTIMHFAASAYVGESVTDPALYFNNNVGGMIALLDAARETKIRQFVFSSSCATYGAPDIVPISEHAPQMPINPYGRTKLICEQMLKDYDAAYGLRHVNLRYFNAAGADPSGLIPERHEPETHLLPLALRAAMGGPTLQVFGNDYNTDDGTCVRDYIHVNDLARGHLFALRYLEMGRASLDVNLGSGQGHSVLDVVAAVARVTGRTVPIRFAPRRAGDPPVLLADPKRAARLLGFKTELSDIDTMAATAAGPLAMPVQDAKIA